MSTDTTAEDRASSNDGLTARRKVDYESLAFPPKRRIPRWAWVTGCIILALALLIIIPRAARAYKIKAELAAMRAEGYPTTLAELDDWYPYPAGENAADTITAAFACFVDTQTNSQGVPIVSDGILPPFGEPLPLEMKSKIAAYLSDNAKALELLHTAAAIPGCRYPVKMSVGAAMNINHLARVRQGQRLLSLQTVMQADEGKMDEAVTTLEAMFALGKSLRGEPLLISQLVRYALDAITVSAAERVMARHPLTDAQLQLLDRLAADEESGACLERAFASEAVTAGDLIADPKSLGMNNALAAIYVLSGMQRQDRLLSLKSSRRAIALSKLPSAEAVAGARAMEKEIQSTRKRKQLPFLPRLAADWMPTWQPLFIQRARDLARFRTMRAAVAVERFRLAKGRLPDNLTELTPEFLAQVPEDPFDGKPLRYARGTKGYVVYSTGADLRDQGGRNSTGLGPAAFDDIGFCVVR